MLETSITYLLQVILIDCFHFWLMFILKFSCIGVSETWLQNSFHNCDIPGYNFVHSPRLNKVGGGVGIYVAKELEFSIRDDLSFTGESVRNRCSLKSKDLMKKIF